MTNQAAKKPCANCTHSQQQSAPSLDSTVYSTQAAKAYDKARYAFERAATGQERQSSPWQAGKLLEQAAACAKETGDLTNVAELTRSAAACKCAVY